MGIGESRATKVQLLSLKKGTFQNQPPVGESYIIKDADGVLKEFKDDGTKTALGGAGALIYASARLARAQALLGTTVAAIYSTDFLPDNSFSTTGGGGSTAAANADSAGVVALDTGVTAGTNAIAFSAAQKVVIGALSTAKWYVHSRTRFIGPIDATVLLGIELCSTAFSHPIVRIGVTGSVSTTNFSFIMTAAGGTTNASGALTIAADLLVYHDFEMWSDGTTVSFAVDGVIGATTPASNLGIGGVMPMVRINNGSATASRTAKADTLAVAVERPAS